MSDDIGFCGNGYFFMKIAFITFVLFAIVCFILAWKSPDTFDMFGKKYNLSSDNIETAVPEEKVGLYCELDLDGNCKGVFIKNESNQFEKIAEDTDGNWS